VLPWSGDEHEQCFYWITEGTDPDQWPVYATDVGPGKGRRFECTATEFLYRQLTDRRHPFAIPASFRATGTERDRPDKSWRRGGTGGVSGGC
jgi:hypothetical protein